MKLVDGTFLFLYREKHDFKSVFDEGHIHYHYID